MNDIIQGIAVAIVLAICAWWIVKRVRPSRKHPGCGCGCGTECPHSGNRCDKKR